MDGRSEVVLLPPADVFETLRTVDRRVTATILDPWYNKGVGGLQEDYRGWLSALVTETAKVSDHVFLWGFPEVVHTALDALPPGFGLVAWLTWYYKNCPSVIRGWRSSQMTCLHIAAQSARVYPEHFLNGVQRSKLAEGKMRFVPGPPSVIEAPLNIGFIGRSEQTGHPAQKPMAVIKPLVLMATVEGDTVLDPMCGSGTTGAVCRELNRNAILCDVSEEYTQITEERLCTKRQASVLSAALP